MQSEPREGCELAVQCAIVPPAMDAEVQCLRLPAATDVAVQSDGQGVEDAGTQVYHNVNGALCTSCDVANATVNRDWQVPAASDVASVSTLPDQPSLAAQISLSGGVQLPVVPGHMQPASSSEHMCAALHEMEQKLLQEQRASSRAMELIKDQEALIASLRASIRGQGSNPHEQSAHQLPASPPPPQSPPPPPQGLPQPSSELLPRASLSVASPCNPTIVSHAHGAVLGGNGAGAGSMAQDSASNAVTCVHYEVGKVGSGSSGPGIADATMVGEHAMGGSGHASSVLVARAPPNEDSSGPQALTPAAASESDGQPGVSSEDPESGEATAVGSVSQMVETAPLFDVDAQIHAHGATVDEEASRREEAREDEVSRLEEQAANFLVALRRTEKQLKAKAAEAQRLESEVSELTMEIMRQRQQKEKYRAMVHKSNLNLSLSLYDTCAAQRS